MTEAGTVVGGKYRLEHLLGEGGMGAVWAATHLLTRKRVAIKLLKADVASADTLKRFVREARAASAVRHPNVVAVHDFLTLDDGSPAMVMDFLEGESLGQRLARQGPIPLAELAAIMAPVVSAVGTAHAAGIVHRDLKPDNIFLARLGDGRVEPMVLDFGIAKVLPFSEEMGGVSALTQSGAMLGTPYYMAPEQAFGDEVDARVDVWALGVILYECSSGLKPIEGETLGQVFKAITTGKPQPLQSLAPQLPSDFVLMVERMMQRSRDDRFSDLREPLRKLRGWAALPLQAVASLPPPQGAAAVDPSAPTGRPRTHHHAEQAPAGLGASAVPVTRGVNRPTTPRSALVLGASLAALVGAGAFAAVSLRPPDAALAPSAAAAPSAVVTASAWAPPTASVVVAEPAVAAAPSVPAPAASARGTSAKPAPRAKPGSAPRKLLPGGVDESPPF